ncbi:MAG: right-handed parallel beta-helix repeat-containing protein, partial [Planctomycetota bacterium]
MARVSMSQGWTLVIAALFLVWPTLAPAAERTFYVSPTGNNASPGSRERPWATPGYGSRQLKPGDTLILRAGRYVLSRFDEDILMPPSGRPEAWVTIRGEEGKRPVLAGRDNLMAAVILDGVSYVRIENLEITHDDRAPGNPCHFREGVHLCDKPGSHISLDRLYIHHLDEFGVNLQDVDHLQMTDCRVEYCGFGAVGGPAGARGGWRNVSIRRCELSYSGHYYQGGDGSKRPYDRPDGFGIEPSAGPVEIV